MRESSSVNIAGFDIGRPLLLGILAAVAIYVLVGLVLYFFQSRLMYIPYRDIVATPADIGVEYREVVLETEDGEELAGWLVEAPEARGAVLFCHGNAGNISYLLGVIDVFHRLGLSVLVFDYRGYGKSSGSPSERGTYMDAEAAWDFLVEEVGVGPEEIIVCGRSLGGSIAAHLARERDPAALFLEASFASVLEMGRRLFPIFPSRLLARYEYDTRAYVSEVDCPVLVVHSRDDGLIPFEHGRQLFAAAGEPKAFVETRGGHNDGFDVSVAEYREGVKAFLGECLE